jgi:hypothetical protein
MFFRSLVLIASLVLVCSCGYSAGPGGINRDVLLFPADSTTQQPLDTEVSADFGSEIEQPPDWSTAFTLTKDGAGDNLCTVYNYDASRHIAYCLHDALDANSSYRVLVNGILAINGAVATWQTTE